MENKTWLSGALYYNGESIILTKTHLLCLSAEDPNTNFYFEAKDSMGIIKKQLLIDNFTIKWDENNYIYITYSNNSFSDHWILPISFSLHLKDGIWK